MDTRPSSTPRFSAARLAVALGVSKRAVLYALGRIPASGVVPVSGNLAPAWTFAELPEKYRGQLIVAAQRQGHRDPLALLTAPTEPWRPPVPLAVMERDEAENLRLLNDGQRANYLAKSSLEKARKLQRALLPVFSREHELAVSGDAFIEFALTRFRSEFGFAVSARHWWRLYERTKQRDRGLEQWERLELFLDDSVFRKSPPPVVPPSDRTHAEHSQALKKYVVRFNGLATPSLSERATLFHEVFTYLESALPTAGQGGERRLKAELIDYLSAACPTLTRPPGAREALRGAFDRKLKRWRAGDRKLSALDDRRPAKSGNFREEDFTADLNKIRDAAILLDGLESLAYRQLYLRGELSEAFRQRYPLNTRKSKSRVPRFVREAITPAVESVLPLKHGPRTARKAGPWIDRDWSDVNPADWFVADDVTWNSYYYEPDGRGGFELHRGECLLATDLRTAYPLGFLLISGRYNSEHIRRLVLQIHDDPCLGLPHRGFYFENSVWNSALVAGLEASALPFHEFTRGLETPGIGLEVRHAQPGNPRSKPIERTIGILQDRMRNEPGFVGFDERHDKRERMQDFLARVRAGKEHPGNELLNKEQWARRIAAILGEFAQEPQNGKMLAGSSPAEAWAAGLQRQPLRKLAPEQRFVLSTHCQTVRVTQKGIRLTIRPGQTRLYAGAATGPFIGREVLAFYNLDAPEMVVISDLDRTHYATVFDNSLPAMDATAEQFARVKEQLRGHTAPARELWSGVRHQVGATVTRDDLHDPATQELGAFVAEATESHLATRETQGRKQRAAERIARQFGNSTVRNVATVERGLDMLTGALGELRAAQPDSLSAP